MKVEDFFKKPTYGYRDVRNAVELREWAKEQGVENLIPAGEMHVTFVYSKEPIDRSELLGPSANRMITVSGGERSMELFGDDNDVLVLHFSHPYLSERHQKALDIGGSWKWDGFKPHITLSYDFDGDIENMEPYRGDIILGPEVYQDIATDWSPAE